LLVNVAAGSSQPTRVLHAAQKRAEAQIVQRYFIAQESAGTIRSELMRIALE
jgi:hypothetical protein